MAIKKSWIAGQFLLQNIYNHLAKNATLNLNNQYGGDILLLELNNNAKQADLSLDLS